MTSVFHFSASRLTQAARTAITPVAAFACLTSSFASASTEATLQPAASLVEATIVEDIGAAERIEAADKLRTLTQEISASACFYYNEIASQESRSRMLSSREAFRRYFDAILNGNPAMNIIGAETRRQTLADLAAIEELWTPLDAAVYLLTEDRSDTAAVNIIKDNGAELFYVTDHLVSELSGDYANPAELMMADVILLDLSGRQSMLSQKIAKNACKLWTQDEAEKARETLARDMQTFETGLNALRFGYPELGLKPAPTAEIEAGLDQVIAAWSETRANLDALLESGSIPRETQTTLYEQLNEKTKTLDEIVQAYVVYAKHDYN